MGREAVCVARYGGNVSEGRARLETDDLRFRGDFRLAIPLRAMRSVEAVDGELRVTFAVPAGGHPGVHPGSGEATFELGAQAEKWARAILHPPALLDKLDVKPTSRVGVLGVTDPDFWTQLRDRTPAIEEGALTSDLNLIVLQADDSAALARIATLEPHLKRTGAIWVVAPKGQPHLTELDVLTTGRAAGYTDVKVARFSATHSAQVRDPEGAAVGAERVRYSPIIVGRVRVRTR
jgi:hypothetical protein